MNDLVVVGKNFSLGTAPMTEFEHNAATKNPNEIYDVKRTMVSLTCFRSRTAHAAVTLHEQRNNDAYVDFNILSKRTETGDTSSFRESMGKLDL